MSRQQIENEVVQFLSSGSPEVLVIVGKWGVGKTFAWKSFLREAQRAGKVQLKRYSYVSLFGLQSVDEIKAVIIENTVDSGKLDLNPDIESINALGERLVNLTNIASSKGSWLTKFLPVGQNYIASANRILYTLAREQIICFDDLERAGKGVELASILGIASDFKENKKSKVVFLLNAEALNEEREGEFRKTLEKVADIVIKYDPTSREVADIGVPGTDRDTSWIRENIIGLNISNIRTMIRVKRLCDDFKKKVPEQDPRVLKQVIRSITLATFARYQPGEAPSVDFILNFNSIARAMDRDKEKNEAEMRHTQLLREFGFWYADDLDRAIFDMVEKGYFEREEAGKVVASAERKVRLSDKVEAYQAAWSKYHHNFSSSEEEIFSDLVTSFRANLEALGSADLDSLVRFLKEFGRQEEAADLIDFYIDNKQGDLDVWDLSSGARFMMVHDADVKNSFDKKLQSMKPGMSLRDALIQMKGETGWNDEILSVISRANAKEYEDLFRSIGPDEFIKVVSASLTFMRVSNRDERMEAANRAALSALDNIAADGKMNAKKVLMIKSNK